MLLLRIALYLLLTILLVSCGNNQLDPKEYIEFVNNKANGLHISKELNNLVFDIQYEPVNYKLSKGIVSKNITEENFKEKKEQLGDMQYFTLRISSEKQEPVKSLSKGEADYSQKLYYFSYSFQNDIALVQGNETLPCLLYHFEKTYTVGNSRTFVLGFAKGKDTLSAKTIKISSDELGVGIANFKISGESISKLQALKLNYNEIKI